MGNWFSVENRGKIMGFWITNTSIGNVFGSQIVSGMIEGGTEWQLALITIIFFYVLSLYLSLYMMKDKPQTNTIKKKEKKKISLIHALMLPGVILYSIVYSCVKLIHYSYMMWLPSYVYSELISSEFAGGAMVSLYDVGGLVGAIVVGWISDKVPNRVYVFFPLLIGTIPLIFAFSLGSSNTLWLFYILIPVVGMIIGGTNNLVSSAVAADLGHYPDKDFDARTTVIGLIDGSGGIGAGIGQIIVGQIQKSSWVKVFIFLAFINVIAVLAIVPLLVRAIRSKNNDIPEIIQGDDIKVNLDENKDQIVKNSGMEKEI